MAAPTPILFNPANSKFEPMGGSGTTIISSDALTIYNGAISTDAKATIGSSVSIAADGVSKNFAAAQFLVPFGNYAITVRARCSNVSSAANALIIKTYYKPNEDGLETLLKTCNIPANNFTSAGEYLNLSFLTPFSGNNTDDKILKVVIYTGVVNGVTIAVDYVSAVLACAAQGAMGTV